MIVQLQIRAISGLPSPGGGAVNHAINPKNDGIRSPKLKPHVIASFCKFLAIFAQGEQCEP